MTDATNNCSTAPRPKARRNEQTEGTAVPEMMIITSSPPSPDSGDRFRKTGRGCVAKAKGKMFGQSQPDPSMRFRASRTDYYSAERTEPTAQPMSPRTKALIDIQTYEGSFKLNATLAALLGVSIADFEAKLAMSVVFGHLTGLSEEQKRMVWATVFVIRVFESQLAGEKDVWGLVVDKARTWVRTLMGDGDIKVLEKEVFG